MPIPREAIQTAQQFAAEQAHPDKQRQVYYNTLAVWAVNDYCQLMEIDTDLTKSDSWNRLVRLCSNVADLEITGLGKLECRPVFENTNFVYIPAEVWEDRIGYVAVAIDKSFKEAALLGFTRAATTEEVSLSQLQSLDELLDCLELPVEQPLELRANLSQWFDNLFEEGWQSVEELLGSLYSPPVAFRRAHPAMVKRAKRIQLQDRSLALLLDLNKDDRQNVRIRAQVYSLTSNTPLPEGLALMVLDETGEPFLESQAGTADRFIQTKRFQFIEQPEEDFTVKIVLGEESVTEAFVVRN
ncbi:MAG: DUF1822 family protein [Cyanobacteriota bacterium]|nr:DUF1822 family protein [Cyanobacteriota bacterium]